MTRHYRPYHGGGHHGLLAQLVLLLVRELVAFHFDRARMRHQQQAQPPPSVPGYFNRPHRIHLWDKVRDKLEQ